MNPYRVTDVAALMRGALKSASYKPALLKALVRVTQNSGDLTIPLRSVGREFTKLYWNQTNVYHLRQSVSLSKEATVVKLIRDIAISNQVKSLSELPDTARSAIDLQMAKLLRVNVLQAFHSSKPPSMPFLYSWQLGHDHIEISSAARAFIKDQASALELIANFYWAQFLESCNRLAPMIIKKVSSDAATRTSLSRYLGILLERSPNECFYCGVPFGQATKPTVDHVIPWSFLLEDELWDLVLACATCNAKKSDWLPTSELLDKLLHRNRIGLAGRALKVREDEIERLYQAAISVEWPRFWSV